MRTRERGVVPTRYCAASHLAETRRTREHRGSIPPHPGGRCNDPNLTAAHLGSVRPTDVGWVHYRRERGRRAIMGSGVHRRQTAPARASASSSPYSPTVTQRRAHCILGDAPDALVRRAVLTPRRPQGFADPDTTSDHRPVRGTQCVPAGRGQLVRSARHTDEQQLAVVSLSTERSVC